MKLLRLELNQFKNYKSKIFEFDKRWICLVGNNGVGKTNVLDAIYLSCIGKSNFLNSEKKLIRHGKDYYRLVAHFERAKLVVKQRNNTPKLISYNGKKYDKLAEHLGKHPILFIGPDDIELINGYSTFRRRWLNIVLCQMDQNYLRILSTYKHILKQRNAYLKSVGPTNTPDYEVLDTYNAQIIPFADQIFRARRQFIDELHREVNTLYGQIADDTNQLGIRYKSDLIAGAFSELLQQNLRQDLLLKRTTVGIHRDDFLIRLNESPAKTYASQGQKKTALFAIQLAANRILEKHQRPPAILLLDDLFDKLDPSRVKRLLETVRDESFTQVFITDAHPNRLTKLTESLQLPHKSITLCPPTDEEEE